MGVAMKFMRAFYFYLLDNLNDYREHFNKNENFDLELDKDVSDKNKIVACLCLYAYFVRASYRIKLSVGPVV